MAKSDVKEWAAALEGFTKESFEADGKRRDIYRAGSGPAVIVISEVPGITPLVADDVAEVIGFVASRPSHVDLDLIVMKPRDQASASRFNRPG